MPHSVELFDALLGKVIMAPEKFQIVLVLNEYGDFLSDMACGLAGSLGIGASANLGFDPAAVVRVALFDAAHGTAPDIAGKNLANPTAIFLALSLLLYQLGEITIGQAVKNATLDLLRQGVRTRDLGGQESTESFTEAVAAEVGRHDPLHAKPSGGVHGDHRAARWSTGRDHASDRPDRGRAGRVPGGLVDRPDPAVMTVGLLTINLGLFVRHGPAPVVADPDRRDAAGRRRGVISTLLFYALEIRSATRRDRSSAVTGSRAGRLLATRAVATASLPVHRPTHVRDRGRSARHPRDRA